MPNIFTNFFSLSFFPFILECTVYFLKHDNFFKWTDISSISGGSESKEDQETGALYSTYSSPEVSETGSKSVPHYAQVARNKPKISFKLADDTILVMFRCVLHGKMSSSRANWAFFSGCSGSTTKNKYLRQKNKKSSGSRENKERSSEYKIRWITNLWMQIKSRELWKKERTLTYIV